MLRKIVVFTFPESQLSIIAISQNTERGNGRYYSHKSTNMSMIRKKIYQTLIVNIQIFNFKIDKKNIYMFQILKRDPIDNYGSEGTDVMERICNLSVLEIRSDRLC